MDPNMNAREASLEVCRRVLPPPVVDEETGHTVRSFAEGNTKLFAKDSTPMKLLHWYQKQVSGLIRNSYRYLGLQTRVKDMLAVIRYVGRQWQEKYFKIKFARISGIIIKAQAMIQCIIARDIYKRRLAILEKQRAVEADVKRLQLAWRQSDSRQKWTKLFLSYQDLTILRELRRTTDWRRISVLLKKLRDRDVARKLATRHIQTLARCILAKEARQKRKTSLACSNRLIYALQIHVKLKITMRRYVQGQGERKRARLAKLLYHHLIFLPHRRSVFTFFAHAIEILQYQFLHRQNFARHRGLLDRWTADARALCAKGYVIELEKHLDVSSSPQYKRLVIFPNLINRCDKKSQNTLLYQAAANGNVLCVKTLLNFKATIDAGTKFHALDQTHLYQGSKSTVPSSARETPLMAAARGGDRNIKLVKALLSCGPEIVREDDPDVKFCESSIPDKTLKRLLAARNADGEAVMDDIINESGPHNEQLMLLLFNLGARCSNTEANEMLQMEVESYYSRIRIKRRRLRRLVDPEAAPLASLDASAAASDIVRVAIGATETTAAAITDGVSGDTVAYQAADSDDDNDDFLSPGGPALNVDDLFAQYQLEQQRDAKLLENNEYKNDNVVTTTSLISNETTQQKDNEISPEQQQYNVKLQCQEAAETAAANVSADEVQQEVAQRAKLQRESLQKSFQSQGMDSHGAVMAALDEISHRQETEVRQALAVQYATAGVSLHEASLQAVEAVAEQKKQQIVQVLAAQLISSNNNDNSLTEEQAVVAAMHEIAAQHQVALQAAQHQELVEEFMSQGLQPVAAEQRASQETEQQSMQQQQIQKKLSKRFETEGASPAQAAVKAMQEIAREQQKVQIQVYAAALKAEGKSDEEAKLKATEEVTQQQLQQRQVALVSVFQKQGFRGNIAELRAAEEMAAVQQRQFVAAVALPCAKEMAAESASKTVIASIMPSTRSSKMQSHSETKQTISHSHSLRPDFLKRFNYLHSAVPIKVKHAAGVSHMYPTDRNFDKHHEIISDSHVGPSSDTLWMQSLSKVLKVSHHSVMKKKANRFNVSFRTKERKTLKLLNQQNSACGVTEEPMVPPSLSRDVTDKQALHRLLFRAVMCYKHVQIAPAKRGWYFPNIKTQQEQGPYPTGRMRAWFKAGHLAMAQPLRFGPKRDQNPREPYVPLASLWPCSPELKRGSVQHRAVLNGVTPVIGNLDGKGATTAITKRSANHLSKDNDAMPSVVTMYNLDTLANERDVAEQCSFPDLLLENNTRELQDLVRYLVFLQVKVATSHR